MSVHADKVTLRRAMRERRLAVKFEKGAQALDLKAVFFSALHVPAGSVVASYIAIGGELDVRELTQALRAQDCTIVLPVVVAKNEALSFSAYSEGDPLEVNRFGVYQPTLVDPSIDPDFLLVPLLAFDAARQRLGYGGGYYDRTLRALRLRKKIQAIGIGYSFQEVVAVPVDAHDVALDAVVTPVKVF